MDCIIANVKKVGFLPVIFFSALLAAGVFHEFVSCILSLILTGALCASLIRNKRTCININLATISVILIFLFYALSVIWAIDRGMAFIGFLKYLPIVLFYIMLSNAPDEKHKILSAIPFFAAATTVVSAILMQISPLEGLFSVAGRLSGFFQYPNTFALFLLVSELLLIKKDKFKYYDYIVLAVILFGILYSGSRTVFVLLVISNLVAAIFTKNKLIKFGVLGAIGVIAVVIVIAAAFDSSGVLQRFSAISLKESTFLGRFLYFYDALPVILKNPFGLGYRGYYYIQQSIQSGVYSVASIHNDFLQLMLDIGWLPALSFIVALAKPVFSKRTDSITKLIIVVLFLHSSFDFNLQFVAVFFLYLLFMDFDAGRSFELSKSIPIVNTFAMALAMLSLYMAIPLTLTNFGGYKAASEIFPYNTQNETVFLTQIQDLDVAFSKAEKILEQNPYVTVAYSVKARYYFSQGDFESVINEKELIFQKFPFQYAEYEEYCYMLMNGITLYNQAGDTSSADYCSEKLLSVPERLKDNLDRLSPLGLMIEDQPNTTLPNDILYFMEQLEAAND